MYEKSIDDKDIKTWFSLNMKQGTFGFNFRPLLMLVPDFVGFKKDLTYKGISFR